MYFKLKKNSVICLRVMLTSVFKTLVKEITNSMFALNFTTF